MNKGNLFVISAPSGCGKDTVLKQVLDKLGENAFLSVSMTTRPMRPGDVEGESYYFVSTDEFERNIKEGQMLEYTRFGSNYYGTPLGPIKKLRSQGKDVFLNIEVEGGANIRRLVPDAVEIFLLPPSMEELERRLRKRGTESEEDIRKRLCIAEEELTHAEEYDYQIVNDDLDTAVEEVMEIVRRHIC